ncbi:MAG: cytochrome c oxidase subunit 3 [Anaerolineae bacterium]
MIAQTTTAYDHEQLTQQQMLKNARMGLALWRFANGMIFLFFAFANALMRSVQASWPPEGVAPLDRSLPILITLVIVASHVTAGRVLSAVRGNRFPEAGRFGVASIALGLVFFIGLIAASASVPYSGAYSSIVLAMQGFHALHMLIALLLMGWVLARVQRGRYNAEKHWGVEAAVIFWHFVDAMWLFFFAVIYIL